MHIQRTTTTSNQHDQRSDPSSATSQEQKRPYVIRALTCGNGRVDPTQTCYKHALAGSKLTLLLPGQNAATKVQKEIHLAQDGLLGPQPKQPLLPKVDLRDGHTHSPAPLLQHSPNTVRDVHWLLSQSWWHYPPRRSRYSGISEEEPCRRDEPLNGETLPAACANETIQLPGGSCNLDAKHLYTECYLINNITV